MKTLLLILLSACVYTSAIISALGPPRWDEVTVNVKALTKIPRTQAEAEEQGWRLLQSDCPPDNEISPFVGERFVGKNGDQTITLIYGANGHLAGIQLSYVRDKTTADVADGEARILYKGRTYATAYFTDTSKVCNADAPTEFGIIAEKLIFLAGKGKEMEIPRHQSSITSESGWKEGKCIPGMGYHHWYNFKKDSLCEELNPFMLMFDKSGNLHAFGFTYFHAIKSSWVEKTFGFVMKYFMYIVPDCLKKARHPMNSMHVFLSSDKSRRECDYSRL